MSIISVSNIDLSLVSTDDMLDELAKRNDAMIFAAYQNRSEDVAWYQRRWHGGNIPALGLARFIQLRIQQACDEMDKVPDDEEEEEC